MSVVAFRGFEESDTPVVSVTDQAGEFLLPQVALHAAAKRAGAQGEAGDFHIALAENDPVGGQSLLRLRAEPGESGGAECCGQEIASGGSRHHPSPCETLYHFARAAGTASYGPVSRA